MTQSSTAHWSIGEVLALLQDEFPEVTISKIRFLESQGLIDPERTPSGYRRFFDKDFERLRWILVQQRDHYLPLKVIRDRLEANDLFGDEADTDPTEPEATPDSPDSDGIEIVADGPVLDLTDGAIVSPADLDLPPSGLEQVTLVPDPHGNRQQAGDQPQPQVQPQPQPQVELEGFEQELGHVDVEGSVIAMNVERVSMTRDELAQAAQCDPRLLHELERFNLIAGRSVGSSLMFDSNALAVARLAVKFGDHGLDPRHLRAFRLGAEREVGLIAQIVEPMLHRRSSTARADSLEALDQLMGLAAGLHDALMQQVLAENFPER